MTAAFAGWRSKGSCDRGLANDVRDDVAYVLMNCRKRLKLNVHDLLTRARLGLTLLLYQDAEAYCELQQGFLESPVWRPFLRLLVNEVKQRRGGNLAYVLRSD